MEINIYKDQKGKKVIKKLSYALLIQENDWNEKKILKSR